MLAIAAGLFIIVWGLYRIRDQRNVSGRISVDTGCESDSSTAADMSGLMPGTTSIRCEPWDIGTGVTGYVWRPPNPRAVVLLQTGWGDYAQRYVNYGSQLIPHLLSRGISVYAFDMWGSGRSPGKRGATHIGQAVADHLAARRKLREQPLPVFILAHSVGGLVAATSVVKDQAGVQGVILLAPALDWGLGVFTRLLAHLGGFVAPSASVPGPAAVRQTRDADAQRRFDSDPLVLHKSVTWVTVRTGVALSRENWTRYHELRIPVFVAHGSADRGPDPSGSQRFISLVGSRDTTLTIIPDGLHGMLDDTSGPEVVQRIVDWLDKHLPPNS
jgi:alpha-beta hydrolase superfamily lysophospholipase